MVELTNLEHLFLINCQTWVTIPFSLNVNSSSESRVVIKL